MRKWNKGNPPHAGWWNASVRRDPDAWRWWNGRCWSISVYPLVRKRLMLGCVDTKTSTKDIEWTTYWPKNARVPRVDPRKAK